VVSGLAVGLPGEPRTEVPGCECYGALRLPHLISAGCRWFKVVCPRPESPAPSRKVVCPPFKSGVSPIAAQSGVSPIAAPSAEASGQASRGQKSAGVCVISHCSCRT
jgi:hypothetical protein